MTVYFMNEINTLYVGRYGVSYILYMDEPA